MKGITSRHKAKLSRTERTISAPFGGALCGKCRERVITEKIKLMEKLKEPSEVEIEVLEILGMKR